MSFDFGEMAADPLHVPRARRFAGLVAVWVTLLGSLVPGVTLADSHRPNAATTARDERGGARTGSLQIVFQGNLALSERELRNEIADKVRDFSRLGYREADADDAAFEMELLYRRKGFPSATVDFRIERSEEGVVLTFTMVEGQRVRVRGIEFHGNSTFSDADLRPFFEEQQDRLSRRNGLLYVASQIDSAISGIRELYFGRGYLDAAIQEPKVTFSEDREWVSISVHIEEGTPYLVHSVVFRGDILAEAEAELGNARDDLVGRSFFPRRKLQLRSRVLEIYGNLGYPDATVHVEDRAGEDGRVVLEAEVTSGPLVTITGISVVGNERTKEHFIRRRVAFRPGDLYSLDKKRKSFRALYATGIFSKVSLVLRDGTEAGERELAVEVEEAPSKEFYFEPSWGSYELLRGTVGLRQNNLFGTGRIANVEIMGAIRAQRATLRLTDPWFLDTEVTADFPLFYRRREEPSFTQKELGAAAQFSKPFTDFVTGTAGYEFSLNESDDVSADALSGQEDKRYTLASVGFQFTYDTRDDLFFPTGGQRSSFSVGLAETFLGGDVTFLRFTGGASFFFRLAKATIFGVRYRGGLIIPGADEISVPINQRFFNGGANTVRSFREAELGPKDSSNDPVGGHGFNVFNVELRQRIGGNFFGTIFFDWGNVSPNRTPAERGNPLYKNRSEILSDTLDDFFHDFRPGIGFGIQYLLPIGPVRFDFAFNPDQDEDRDEDFFVFHFSVGTAF